MILVSENAVQALVEALSPTGAVVVRDQTAPIDTGPEGLLIVHTGIPGDPIDTVLSPLRRVYDHAALIEVRTLDDRARRGSGVGLTELLSRVSAAIESDPTLNGRADSVRLRPPTALLPNMPLPSDCDCRLIQVFVRYTIEGRA